VRSTFDPLLSKRRGHPETLLADNARRLRTRGRAFSLRVRQREAQLAIGDEIAYKQPHESTMGCDRADRGHQLDEGSDRRAFMRRCSAVSWPRANGAQCTKLAPE